MTENQKKQSALASLRKKIAAGSTNHVVDDSEGPMEECAHFYFVGQWKGADTVFDAVLSTLRLEHESELHEAATRQVLNKYPAFQRVLDGKDLDEKETQAILNYFEEVVDEMEDDDEIKVKEFVEVDEENEIGVGLDAALHVEAITPEVLRKFVEDYNAGKLVLDPSMYSFQRAEE